MDNGNYDLIIFFISKYKFLRKSTLQAYVRYKSESLILKNLRKIIRGYVIRNILTIFTFLDTTLINKNSYYGQMLKKSTIKWRRDQVPKKKKNSFFHSSDRLVSEILTSIISKMQFFFE